MVRKDLRWEIVGHREMREGFQTPERPTWRMLKAFLALDERTGFPWKGLLMLSACAWALLATPMRGQDDNGAAPPQPDTAADDAIGAPEGGASFQTFYDSLGSQGTWVQSGEYGYVWQPQVDDPNWAPYTAGHWVYTDDGWTWVSDEPWGWATYHYGRWVNLDGTGWCWVPGYTWAPAWVSWRYGGGYCGWAPLPPDSFVGIDYSDDGSAIGVGFHIGGDCDGFYGIGAGWYHFLPVTCLGYRNYRGFYRDRHDNYAIINRTTNVTNINVTRNASGGNAGGATTGPFHQVTVGGPMLAQVNAVSQTPVPSASLVRANQPGGGGALTDDSLALYAPRVNPGATGQPSRVAGSIGPATINRGIDIMSPLAVNSRLAPSPASDAQVRQARIARDHAPAGAKVVTDRESVRPVLQAPLTSLKPVARQVTSSPTFNTSPKSIYNTERAPSAPGIAPTVRTYPQTGEGGGAPPRFYPPGAVYPPESRQYVRPTAPAPSSPVASGTHPSAGVYSGGGGGSSNGGEGSHAGSGGRENSHAGGASGGSYQQQGQGH